MNINTIKYEEYTKDMSPEEHLEFIRGPRIYWHEGAGLFVHIVSVVIAAESYYGRNEAMCLQAEETVGNIIELYMEDLEPIMDIDDYI